MLYYEWKKKVVPSSSRISTSALSRSKVTPGKREPSTVRVAENLSVGSTMLLFTMGMLTRVGPVVEVKVKVCMVRP